MEKRLNQGQNNEFICCSSDRIQVRNSTQSLKPQWYTSCSNINPVHQLRNVHYYQPLSQMSQSQQNIKISEQKKIVSDTKSKEELHLLMKSLERSNQDTNIKYDIRNLKNKLLGGGETENAKKILETLEKIYSKLSSILNSSQFEDEELDQAKKECVANLKDILQYTYNSEIQEQKVQNIINYLKYDDQQNDEQNLHLNKSLEIIQTLINRLKIPQTCSAQITNTQDEQNFNKKQVQQKDQQQQQNEQISQLKTSTAPIQTDYQCQQQVSQNQSSYGDEFQKNTAQKSVRNTFQPKIQQKLSVFQEQNLADLLHKIQNFSEKFKSNNQFDCNCNCTKEKSKINFEFLIENIVDQATHFEQTKNQTLFLIEQSLSCHTLDSELRSQQINDILAYIKNKISSNQELQNQQFQQEIDIEQKFNTDFYYKKVQYIIENVVNSDQFSQNQDTQTIVLLGKTGAGKSTFLHLLLGKRFVRVEKSYTYEGKTYTLNQIQPEVIIPGFEIGHNSNSQTQRVGIIQADNRYLICDTPGFNDTSGDLSEIINSVGISKLLNQCKNVRPVLIINYHELDNQRGGSFLQTIQQLDTLMAIYGDYVDSLTVFFSRVPTDKGIEDIKAKIISIANYIDQNQNPQQNNKQQQLLWHIIKQLQLQQNKNQNNFIIGLNENNQTYWDIILKNNIFIPNTQNSHLRSLNNIGQTFFGGYCRHIVQVVEKWLAQIPNSFNLYKYLLQFDQLRKQINVDILEETFQNLSSIVLSQIQQKIKLSLHRFQSTNLNDDIQTIQLVEQMQEVIKILDSQQKVIKLLNLSSSINKTNYFNDIQQIVKLNLEKTNQTLKQQQDQIDRLKQLENQFLFLKEIIKDQQYKIEKIITEKINLFKQKFQQLFEIQFYTQNNQQQIQSIILEIEIMHKEAIEYEKLLQQDRQQLQGYIQSKIASDSNELKKIISYFFSQKRQKIQSNFQFPSSQYIQIKALQQCQFIIQYSECYQKLYSDILQLSSKYIKAIYKQLLENLNQDKYQIFENKTLLDKVDKITQIDERLQELVQESENQIFSYILYILKRHRQKIDFSQDSNCSIEQIKKKYTSFFKKIIYMQKIQEISHLHKSSNLLNIIWKKSLSMIQKYVNTLSQQSQDQLQNQEEIFFSQQGLCIRFSQLSIFKQSFQDSTETLSKFESCVEKIKEKLYLLKELEGLFIYFNQYFNSNNQNYLEYDQKITQLDKYLKIFQFIEENQLYYLIDISAKYIENFMSQLRKNLYNKLDIILDYDYNQTIDNLGKIIQSVENLKSLKNCSYIGKYFTEIDQREYTLQRNIFIKIQQFQNNIQQLFENDKLEEAQIQYLKIKQQYFDIKTYLSPNLQIVVESIPNPTIQIESLFSELKYKLLKEEFQGVNRLLTIFSALKKNDKQVENYQKHLLFIQDLYKQYLDQVKKDLYQTFLVSQLSYQQLLKTLKYLFKLISETKKFIPQEILEQTLRNINKYFEDFLKQYKVNIIKMLLNSWNFYEFQQRIHYTAEVENQITEQLQSQFDIKQQVEQFNQSLKDDVSQRIKDIAPTHKNMKKLIEFYEKYYDAKQVDIDQQNVMIYEIENIPSILLQLLQSCIKKAQEQTLSGIKINPQNFTQQINDFSNDINNLSRICDTTSLVDELQKLQSIYRSKVENQEHKKINVEFSSKSQF